MYIVRSPGLKRIQSKFRLIAGWSWGERKRGEKLVSQQPPKTECDGEKAREKLKRKDKASLGVAKGAITLTNEGTMAQYK